MNNDKLSFYFQKRIIPTHPPKNLDYLTRLATARPRQSRSIQRPVQKTSRPKSLSATQQRVVNNLSKPVRRGQKFTHPPRRTAPKIKELSDREWNYFHEMSRPRYDHIGDKFIQPPRPQYKRYVKADPREAIWAHMSQPIKEPNIKVIERQDSHTELTNIILNGSRVRSKKKKKN